MRIDAKLKRTLITLLALFSLWAYSYFIEPVWIMVTHHTIAAKVNSPLKIAHLSDLHIYEPGYREKKLLLLLQKEKPDVILISGDSISLGGNYQGLGKFLKELRAPLGVFLVRGNWEHWRPHPDELKIYAEAGIHFLDNSNHQVRDEFWIIGLDDNLAGAPNLGKATPGLPKNAFKIGLFHSPDFFSTHSDSFDLVLAGHTHGGQIRIPFLPPLWLPEGSGPYVEGWYAAGSKAKMYVSRGIGNSVLEIRFFCRPELPIIEIIPER